MTQDSERKQPQNVNYQQISSQLGDVINLLQNAPESPRVTQAIEQLREITQQMRTARAA